MFTILTSTAVLIAARTGAKRAGVFAWWVPISGAWTTFLVAAMFVATAEKPETGEDIAAGCIGGAILGLAVTGTLVLLIRGVRHLRS